MKHKNKMNFTAISATILLGIAIGISVYLIARRKKSSIRLCPIIKPTSSGATILLPEAGTIDGPCRPIGVSGLNLFNTRLNTFGSNLLLFKSQMYAYNDTCAAGRSLASGQVQQRFNFPKVDINGQPSPSLNEQLAALFPSSGGLYNQKAAQTYGLPWPPMASAQLVSYFQNTKLVDENSQIFMGLGSGSGSPVIDSSPCNIWQINEEFSPP